MTKSNLASLNSSQGLLYESDASILKSSPKNFQCERMWHGFWPRSGAVGVKPNRCDLFQEVFGENTPSRVASAQKEDLWVQVCLGSLELAVADAFV